VQYSSKGSVLDQVELIRVDATEAGAAYYFRTRFTGSWVVAEGNEARLVEQELVSMLPQSDSTKQHLIPSAR
jgi:hypothetical protein